MTGEAFPKNVSSAGTAGPWAVLSSHSIFAGDRSRFVFILAEGINLSLPTSLCFYSFQKGWVYSVKLLFADSLVLMCLLQATWYKCEKG